MKVEWHDFAYLVSAALYKAQHCDNQFIWSVKSTEAQQSIEKENTATLSLETMCSASAASWRLQSVAFRFGESRG